MKEIKNSPEGNFDDFDYDLSIEQSFNDEQFESLSEYFKSQGEEIVPEDIKEYIENKGYQQIEYSCPVKEHDICIRIMLFNNLV